MSMFESEIEQITLNMFRDENGYLIMSGSDISEGEKKEREYTEVILQKRLKAAIDRINPSIPAEARNEALNKTIPMVSATLMENNEAFHRLLTDGIDVKFSIGDGELKIDKVWLVDFVNPENNDFLAINQFPVLLNYNSRLLDIVLFINGLPMVVLELKNRINENVDVNEAFSQLQSYIHHIPSLYTYNAFLVISDGWFAKVGTLSNEYNRFMEWKSSDGESIADPKRQSSLKSMIKGLLNKRTFLDVIRYFIVYEKTKEKTVKRIATYYQYYAVNKAITKTIEATTSNHAEKKGRVGVVWQTSGSGKSLTMVFYVGKVVLTKVMNNPTVVILTDRNVLEQQLFERFSNCQQLIRQTPQRAATRDDLKKLLSVFSGGVIFTTIQKFLPIEMGDSYPLLSDRSNIVIIVDEAHRSQYSSYAHHMRVALPNASFIGFTGSPIIKGDRITEAVFGDYVHIYNFQQAINDGLMVPIYYESRVACIGLSVADRETVELEMEDVTENDELTERQRWNTVWTNKELVVGNPIRLHRVAVDLVNHFEKRFSATEGKALIICMSRRICVELHNEIIKLRPRWYDESDSIGEIKVIMNGSPGDPFEWQEHIRNTSRTNLIANRLRDPKDPLKMIIVRDMLLTGFDAPCLNTLYIDKPMKDHILMQAIGRVNRIYDGKMGGLIVDYFGIEKDLKVAWAEYTDYKGKGELAYDQEEAVAKMKELFEVIVDMFHGLDYRRYFNLESKDKLSFILDAANFIGNLTQKKDGKLVRNGVERFKENVTRLRMAFGLSVPHSNAFEIRDDLAFFLAIKARYVKFDTQDKKWSDDEIETTIRQNVNDAIISREIVDIFDAAGVIRPDFSILSDDFLEEIQGMYRKNLAFELLKRLLNDEIKSRAKTNLIQGKKFSEVLIDAVKRYQFGLIDSAKIIEELINLAKDIRDADKRGEKLDLRVDELAFYDVLADNLTAEVVLGDQTLKLITHELVDSVRNNTSIDWQLKESVQAKLRVLVKRILRKYKYPPDDPTTGEYTVSVNKVLDQAELLADYWTKE